MLIEDSNFDLPWLLWTASSYVSRSSATAEAAGMHQALLQAPEKHEAGNEEPIFALPSSGHHDVASLNAATITDWPPGAFCAMISHGRSDRVGVRALYCNEADMGEDTEPNLSLAESQDLHRIAGLMIPPSEAFGLPGADDAIIFADVVRSFGRDLKDVKAALSELMILAGGRFIDLDEVRAEAVAKILLARGDRAAVVLGRVILQSYYRDDRVLNALGLEARAPFPKGHALEQGDWSLLTVVQGRPPQWRDDRGR